MSMMKRRIEAARDVGLQAARTGAANPYTDPTLAEAFEAGKKDDHLHTFVFTGTHGPGYPEL